MDHYIRGAVEEYIENSRGVLEDMRDQGVFSQADVEEQLERIRANIEKNIESNKPYAMLLMEMDRGKRKTNNDDKFVSLTKLQSKKTLKIQVMLFKAG